MPQKTFFQQLGTGVASLTFGVALSIFIYAAASGVVNSMQAWLLFATSFLLMMRFWWRYVELFVQFLPSRNFLQFLFDFLVSILGITAVLFVGSMQTWAVIGVATMLMSIIRCGLSWGEAAKGIKQKLRRTIAGSTVMLVIMAVVYGLANVVSQLWIAAAVFIITLIFVAWTTRRP